MKPLRIPEKAVQRSIVTLLQSIGAHVYVLGGNRPKGDKAWTGQTPGIPDLYAFLPIQCGPAVTLWVEVKASGGKLRPAQAAFREQCGQANQYHIVGGLDHVLAWLKRGGWVK